MPACTTTLTCTAYSYSHRSFVHWQLKHSITDMWRHSSIHHQKNQIYGSVIGALRGHYDRNFTKMLQRAELGLANRDHL
jgi:hypothetical protein